MRRSKSGGHSNFYSTSKEAPSRSRSRKPEEGADFGSRGPAERDARPKKRSTSTAGDESRSSGFRENARRENVIEELKQLRQRVQSLEKKVTEQRQAMLQLERSNSAITEDVSEVVRRVERAYADATRLRSPPRSPCIISSHRTSRISASSSCRPSSRYSALSAAAADDHPHSHPAAAEREQQASASAATATSSGIAPAARDPNCKSEADASTLFPGLPDEITINRILTLVPWCKLYLLSTLNRSWQHAFRSRQVHDARARCGAQQALFVLSHPSLVSLLQKSYDFKKLALSLYDAARNAWHFLPSPADGVAKTWRLGHFETVFVDGRLYVLGGLFKEKSGEVLHKGDEVHMLDLGACESTWRRCASMGVVRERFGCAAVDGKVFVFGGLEPHADKYEYEYYRDREIWTNCEVFDPARNEWSSVESMPLGRIGHSVVDFRGELFMYGGNARPKGWSRYEDLEDMKDSDFTDAYNPACDRWRQVENFAKLCPQGALLLLPGQDGQPACICDVTKDAIFRYDDAPFGYKRTRIQSHKMVSPGWSEEQYVSSCVAVDNELFALLVFRKKYYADEGGILYCSPEAVLMKRSFDLHDASCASEPSGSGSLSPTSSFSASFWTSRSSAPRPPAFVYLDNLPASVEALCPTRSRLVSVQL
ncbi:hypothetical protein MPTK1_7g04930 [Marchantia polymorpha subsp. ruderalis]|uniref:F-box domain-containing protein n=2 Tax=Marchantia polymorpha TaxID=3197 RepID=A0AAF6BW91_MARPO|nr:hypothetical protein MARPO_0062s0033 [Marchantia polymorpha]BBN16275.1 hypothetical protein Mp_7g04930 [Marchantia polymorpha subsp. ruderalis]|eukprot:PTQ36607.1 hypothetical protein MARPO_0062s0033 [Marchantia polymorpha]